MHISWTVASWRVDSARIELFNSIGKKLVSCKAVQQIFITIFNIIFFFFLSRNTLSSILIVIDLTLWSIIWKKYIGTKLHTSATYYAAMLCTQKIIHRTHVPRTMTIKMLHTHIYTIHLCAIIKSFFQKIRNRTRLIAFIHNNIIYYNSLYLT